MVIVFNAERFKKERIKHHISQRSLAYEAETSERYVRDLEKGYKTNPSAEKLFRISKALSVPMNDLMTVVEGEE